MKKQPYVSVDWRQIETVREAMKKGSILTVRGLNGYDPRHRKTLMALSPAERAKLVKLDNKLASEIGTSAAFLCHEGHLAEGIALFDLVVTAGYDPTAPAAGSTLATAIPLNATFYLLAKAPAELKTPERGRLYFDYFRPVATTNTALLLNLAEIARDLLHDGETAIALLRQAIELGDPTIRQSLVEDKAAWKGLPGFDTLASVTSNVPVGLRAFQLWSDMRSSEWTGPEIEYFHLRAFLCEPAWQEGLEDTSFEVFGQSLNGDRWALWRRDPKAPREGSPVIVLSREGTAGVYAASVDGMMSLSTTDWDLDKVLELGYQPDDEGWKAPAKLAKLKPIKERVARLQSIVPNAMKLDPDRERAKALALMPELIAEMTRRRERSGVAAAAPKKPAQKKPAQKTKTKTKTTFDIGFANVPAAERPADIEFLHSKAGKGWLKTLDLRLLGAKGEPPDLLEHFDVESDDLDVKANARALRDVLGLITFAIEALNDNATLYGYWRGTEKTALAKAPIVSFDSEGTIARENGASILDVLLQKGSYDEPEQFLEWKAKLEKSGVKIAGKAWDDYRDRGKKWPSDPEKLHDKLYQKYRKELGAK